VTISSKDQDHIRVHGERIATLEERIQNLQRHVDEDIRQEIERVDKDIRRDVDRISKILETRKEHEWSLRLGLIMALVALAGAIIGGGLAKVFEVLLTKVVR
jgi:hypothetical protein